MNINTIDLYSGGGCFRFSDKGLGYFKDESPAVSLDADGTIVAGKINGLTLVGDEIIGPFGKDK